MSTDTYLVGFSLVVTVWSFWAIACTNKTSEQRGQIIEAISAHATISIHAGDRQWRRFYGVLDEVSFHKHFWHLLTFRDAMKLYDGWSDR